MNLNEEKLVEYAHEWAPFEVTEYRRMKHPRYNMGDWPKWYLLEIVVHEMGHIVDLGLSLDPAPESVDDLLKALTHRRADYNEVRASVVTSEVASRLGAPFTLHSRISENMEVNIGRWWKFSEDRDNLAHLAAFQKMRHSAKTKKMADAVCLQLKSSGVIV